MGKNKARHLLHGILDLLPVFVIPIFALNILHKETEPISITTGGYEYQKRYETNAVSTKNDLVENNYYYLNYTFIDTTQFGTITNLEYDSNFYEFYETIGDYNANYIEVIDCNMLVRPNASNVGVIVNWTIGEVCLYKEGANNRVSWKFDVPVNVANTNVTGDYQNNGSATTCAYCGITCVFQYKTTQFINDNLMTYISELPSEYQIYDKVYNEEIVYDNTDIGSQFVYTLYNTVDKYFNMGNVFNMNDVYDWFVINIFGGNASMSIYIVWNIVLYEFVMDLLFLLYGLFMFFIDMCKRLMEKPLNSIK